MLSELIDDHWFMISYFCEYTELVSLAGVNTAMNAAINQPRIWEQQCRRYFNVNGVKTQAHAQQQQQQSGDCDDASMNVEQANNSNNNSNDNHNTINHDNKYKYHFRGFIELYGHDSVHCYKRVMRCWKAIQRWCDAYLPRLKQTFNPPASKVEINALKQWIANENNVNTTSTASSTNKTMKKTATTMKTRSKSTEIIVTADADADANANANANTNTNNNHKNDETLSKKNSTKPRLTFPVSYLIFLGECCNGQRHPSAQFAQAPHNDDRLGFYGYYAFYNHSSTSRLHSIQECLKLTTEVRNQFLESNPRIADLYFYSGCVPYKRGCTLSQYCLTFLRLTDEKIVKLSSDKVVMDGLSHSGSFLTHLEFYVAQLMHQNYRVTGHGILRFPLTGGASSQHESYGIVCRGCPLFVAEESYVGMGTGTGSGATLRRRMREQTRRYMFPYHIEIECPAAHTAKADDECIYEGVLTTRKWRIECDGKVEEVNGPGVIGLHPKVYPGQELFSYESCSHQKHPTNGRMWGSFVFQNTKDDAHTFELEIKPYLLSIEKCQWI